VKEEWKQDPVAGYRENARHLFGYPDSTLSEYVRDVEHFQEWSAERTAGKNGHVGKDAEAAANRQAAKNSDAGKNGQAAKSEQAGKALAAVLLLGCTRDRIEDWIVALSNRGLRAVSINRKIASLNSFFVWAVHQGLMPLSPLMGIRKLKIPRRIPKFLTFEDIQRLLTCTGSLRRTSTIRGKQVHAIISILYYLGLRRAELVSIRYEHIYRERERLLGRLPVLEAQTKTASLELERVKIGLEIGNLGFDPIDLAQAEEKVARLIHERQTLLLEVENARTRILALLGKGRSGP
jgi:site-specific recombinase XerD